MKISITLIGIICLFFIGSLASSFSNSNSVALRAFSFNESLTSLNEYNINSNTDFINFTSSVNSGDTYKNIIVNLNCDIYLNTSEEILNGTATQTTTIGNFIHTFSGTFNGNNHFISGIYCSSYTKEYFSLFGYLDGATITNLKLLNVSINVNGYAAALAYNVNNSTISNIEVNGNLVSNNNSSLLVHTITNSKIFNCFTSGEISCSSEKAAGLVVDANNSTILNCYNLSNVSSNSICAGICAYADSSSKVINCLNNSNLSCKNSYATIGGVVGYNLGNINNCYFKNLNINNSTIKSYGEGLAGLESNCYGFDNASENVDIIINNSTYTSILSALNAGASYYSSNDTVLSNWINSENPQFATTKQENEFTTFLICDNITFGETPSPKISAKFGTPKFLYSESLNGDFTETIPTSAGTYFVKAVVTETDSYTGLTTSPVSFAINKAHDEIVLINDNLNMVYNANKYINPTATCLSEITIYCSYYYKSDTNFENKIDAPISCGNYTIKFSTLETSNYLPATKYAYFSITKATLTDTTLNIKTTYNGNYQNIQVSASGFCGTDSMNYANISYSEDGINYSNINPSFINHGTYTVYYKLEFINYNNIIGNKTLTINKANYLNITHPTLSGEYNISKKLSDYVLNNGFSWKDENITPTCNISTYEATYNADPTNYNNYDLEITLNLTPKIVTTPEFKEVYTYNGNAQTFSFKNLDESLIDVEYFSKTDAGSYDVNLYLKDEINYTFYNGESTLALKFTINKANFENKSLNITYTTVYEANRTLQNYIDILHEKFEIPKFYYFTSPSMEISAGEHKIEMYYNSNPTNFNNYYFTINLNITKASYNNLMLTYASDSTFTIGENGEYIFVYDNSPKNIFVTGLTSDMDFSVAGGGEIEVGVYTISATISCDPNYNTPTIEPLTYKIVKANYNNFTESDISYTYENNILTLIYKQGFNITIKLNEAYEYSNSVYAEPTNNLVVYYLITSKNYNDMIGTITLNLNSTLPNSPTEDNSNNSPENENNNNNNQNENNNNENNSNNNENNSNNKNNSNENANNTLNSSNNINIKNVVLISICAAALICIIVIVVIKIKRK